MIKKIQGVTKAIKGLKTAVGSKKTRARNKKSTAELRNKATKDAFKKANSKKAYDVLRDGDEQAKRNYREIIKDAKDSGFPYSKKEKEEIRRFGSTKAEMKAESDTARREVSTTVKDMGGFSKGGMVTKWESKWG